jgi:hypothetical protein
VEAQGEGVFIQGLRLQVLAQAVEMVFVSSLIRLVGQRRRIGTITAAAAAEVVLVAKVRQILEA